MVIDPELAPVEVKLKLLLQEMMGVLAADLTGPKASRRLLQIQEVSELGKQLLVVVSGGKTNRRKGRYSKDHDWNDDFDDTMDEDGTSSGFVGTSSGAMQSTATSVETFGAKILQEGLAMIPQLIRAQQHAQVPSVIAAIQAARDAGLHKVASEMEQKLHRDLELDYTVRPEPEGEVKTIDGWGPLPPAPSGSGYDAASGGGA